MVRLMRHVQDASPLPMTRERSLQLDSLRGAPGKDMPKCDCYVSPETACRQVITNYHEPYVMCCF